MELKQCNKGHYYDSTITSTCPQCAAEQAAEDKKPDYDPADNLMELTYGPPTDYIDLDPNPTPGVKKTKCRACGYVWTINKGIIKYCPVCGNSLYFKI